MRTARTIICLFAFASSLHLIEISEAQQPSAQSTGREFPVVYIQIGDVPVALPKDWVDNKFANIHLGNSRIISFVNVHMRPSPRSKHFEFPRVILFGIVEPAAGLPERNLRESKANLEKRQSEQAPDEFGFWLWKAREYVLIDMPYARPLGQPLTVSCMPSPPRPKEERMCTVRFYWTLAASVDYTFFDSDYPESRWAELDQRVLELLKFLDGREAWPATKPAQ
ncbi:MAG: hypothetical protein WC670_08255 [Pseudolabrys sp.]|jgi:hypothetical protein